MIKYSHKVQYYETDKMGVTHHSNYIRWMEEARVDLLDRIGLPFSEMEKQGIVSPVVSIEAKYKRPTTFEDVIEIETRVECYNGIRLVFAYAMRNAATGDIVVEARSTQCFLCGGKPIALNRTFPDIDGAFKSAIDKLK